MLRTGKMSRLDEPVWFVTFPPQRYPAGRLSFALVPDGTASRGESLLKEPALFPWAFLLSVHDRDFKPPVRLK